jgi:CBS domain containing-hemolysin-like protein
MRRDETMTLITALTAMAVLLLLKGFFSGSEIALVSADKIQMRHRARQGEKGARLLLKMFQRPDRLLTTTLVGTNIATVALTTIGTLTMVEFFGQQGDFYAFLIFTPILLVFGEIVPKSIYQQKAELLAPLIAYPLKAVSWLLFPIIFLFSQVARVATRLAGAGKASHSFFLTREQLRAVVEMTERRIDLSAFRHGRIRRAIRFADTQAAEIMTPLRDITFVGSNESIQHLVSVVHKNGYRPIPVYKGDTVNIIGMICLSPWEILNFEVRSASVTDLMHPPYYAAPRQTIGQLLPILSTRADQSAIIVDEFGSAVGLVTLQDILEVVIGEVRAGYHFDKHPVAHQRTLQVIEDGIYVMDARLPVSEVNDLVGLNLSAGDYRTIGGMLLTQLRRIPRQGDFVIESGYRFTVEEATEKEVVRVRAEPES